MSILAYVDDLLVVFVSADFLSMWFFPLMAFAFMVTVPRLIRYFMEG